MSPCYCILFKKYRFKKKRKWARRERLTAQRQTDTPLDILEWENIMSENVVKVDSREKECLLRNIGIAKLWYRWDNTPLDILELENMSENVVKVDPERKNAWSEISELRSCDTEGYNTNRFRWWIWRSYQISMQILISLVAIRLMGRTFMYLRHVQSLCVFSIDAYRYTGTRCLNSSFFHDFASPWALIMLLKASWSYKSIWWLIYNIN